MDTKELLKKVRKIEIKTKGLTSQIFSGEYHSAFKGKGMAFNEVREYALGDEIRTIDWNVTARFNEPFVKVFEEERELTVMLIIDISPSGMFGTKNQLKRETITELCAVLAFSASSNKDRIGVILFSDKVEKYLPPKKGKSHILQIIRTLLNVEPQGKTTNIESALQFLSKIQKKKATVFLLSDFKAKDYSNALKIVSRKHDLIALKIADEGEYKLPSIGLAKFKDLESGKSVWVNTNAKKVKAAFEEKQKTFDAAVKQNFRKLNVDYAALRTDQDYIKPLMNLFDRRTK
ncbi:DUF58 domain-containing protein [Putridiphycobacter roseus]|uniref:DUF58 domain-containing protein n=1 Tax=Putridiphycobacter roseus TaxID=2219161 RepID=A0A2W1MZR6_9FLAO|nr:DUF58 domain-containing protein [Putridiphycobacter roseus]PZE16760.1 DUF58 domain-containing protein [Putridiphycobacter roseus]